VGAGICFCCGDFRRKKSEVCETLEYKEKAWSFELIVIQQGRCNRECAIYLPSADPSAVVQFRFRGTRIWHTCEESRFYWVACILICGCLSLSIRKQEVSREFTESVVTSHRPTSLHGHLVRLACQATLPHQVQEFMPLFQTKTFLYHWTLVDNVELTRTWSWHLISLNLKYLDVPVLKDVAFPTSYAFLIFVRQSVALSLHNSVEK
jgi:hypothetical protein